jgi:hypothetical protein
VPERSSPAPSLAETSPALLASTGTTTLIVVGALLVLAAAMVLVAVWLVRATRRDAAALGPLAVMGERRWRRADPPARAVALAAARPPGAPEPAPMIDVELVDPATAVSPDSEPGSDAESETPSDAPAPDAPELVAPAPSALGAEPHVDGGDSSEGEDVEVAPHYARDDG